MKFINTADPAYPEKHYYIPIEQRVDLDEIKRLIEQKKYFTLHASRFTSYLRQLRAGYDMRKRKAGIKRSFVKRDSTMVRRLWFGGCNHKGRRSNQEPSCHGDWIRPEDGPR